MYLIKIMLCTLVLTITQLRCSVYCHPYGKNIDDVISKRNTSLFDDKTQIVIIDENVNTFLPDNINVDDSAVNARESPETSKEALYQDLFNDYGSSYSLYDPGDDEPECILARSEFYLSWWVHENGSLRLPSFNRLNTSGILDLSLQFDSETTLFNHVLNFTSDNPHEVIRFMSVASNKLDQIPASVLNLTSATIQYLSLAGNNFYGMFEYENTTFQNFTSFPLMSHLLELDLRSCHIRSLSSDYFKNLPRLDKLFLSHNNFLIIEASAFAPLTKLRHLDLSYNTIPFEIENRIEGMILEEFLFEKLEHLMFLDLSHSKLRRRSLLALKSLGHEMKQLSLCHTGIVSFPEGMLNNTSLNVLDLSGNLENFKELAELEILDLGSNNINNWYERVFTENEKLRIVNLRSNNITFMREGMIRDFYEIRYLAIGSNDYICACNLRDFIDRATRNALYHYCSERNKRSIEETLTWNNPEHQYNVFLREFHMIVAYYEESYRNMILNSLNPVEVKMRSVSKNLNTGGLSSFSERDCYNFDSDEVTRMNFNFLLLDYNENDYECLEEAYGYSTSRRVRFHDVESCYSDEKDTTEPYDGSSDDESNEEPTDDPDNVTTDSSKISSTTTEGSKEDDFFRPIFAIFKMNYLYILLFIPVSLFAFFWYRKRADIKYFCTLFKNSIILSLDNEDKKTLMMTNRKKSLTSGGIIDEYQYDVFVSYSDKDRSWVLDELIPNIEKRAEINICLHERDFQVGLSILENIIQCMDRSRCLLLVVSESFLKSNWCAFEMHLAQHRLIETRREQLILVLLQDIPRSKRTRTLQFLMRTKTYIQWPHDDKEESKLTFWKRLRKAIILNNWEPEKKVSKPRHSIV
ncbi:hypothetical protein PVAND_008291 [Polypedilum vanderplanki]|uniref:TIR domain-containing protein n=1 Tax=Polypedilum vanderplanki TaxID=319348 RepID=A0A9J6CA51_POLVA|nr:hypothetical protein PVAND_008291 [Polypedilum vanderplanki]